MHSQASPSALLRSLFTISAPAALLFAQGIAASTLPLAARHGANTHVRSLNATNACHSIASAISNSSAVFWPLTVQYTQDNDHFMSSSSQASACSVEPGTAVDVGIVLQILGSSRTPFAVKGGGHASNPGYSSTTGVMISMSRFNQVTYNAASNTTDIGTGIIWDDVYEALGPLNVNVVGGRVSGVGVAGFTLGGGYSWKTSQFGLTIDTIEAYELVLPSGNVTTVTASSNPDLFFGLRGGFNNFGIVTKFTLKTFPQTQVWGGLVTYPLTSIPALTNATADFLNTVTDAKAAIIMEYNVVAGIPLATASIFYDAPTPPAGIFDALLAVPHLSEDISTRSFLSLVQSSPAQATANLRGLFNTVSVTSYSKNLLDVIVNETLFWGQSTFLESGIFITYDVESFRSDLFSHSSTPSAYPPDRSRGLLPLNLYFAWTLPTSDALLQSAIEQSALTITNAANAEGQNIGDAPLYGNYAVFSTPLERIYGDNLPRLRSIKATYDPQNVMSLAGGWKF